MFSFKFYREKTLLQALKDDVLSFQKLLFQIFHLPFLRISAAMMSSVMSDSSQPHGPQLARLLCS